MTPPIRSYRDLVAWQMAVDITKQVYRATERFPDKERYGLTNQLRRAAVSVPSNIAEGFGRGRAPDYARFLRVARGSLYEMETQLFLAVELGYLDQATFDQLDTKLKECGRVLAGLLRSLGVPDGSGG